MNYFSYDVSQISFLVCISVKLFLKKSILFKDLIVRVDILIKYLIG